MNFGKKSALEKVISFSIKINFKNLLYMIIGF